MLSNNLLIITGALVGSSGAILSYIMCKAMNRSFIAVILGGFGTEPLPRQVIRTSANTTRPAEQLAELLDESQSIVIAPGYGMAVARRKTRSRNSPRSCGTWARRCGSRCTRSPVGCPVT